MEKPINAHDEGIRAVQTARVLAEHQGHWLERLVMPLLVVGFILSVVNAAMGFIDLYLPHTVPRWLFFVAFLASLESVYVWNLLTKARAPVSLKAVELGLVVALVAVPLVLTGTWRPGEPLSGAIRDPSFLIPISLVLLSWYLAGTGGQRLAAIGNIAGEIGDQAASTLSWEQESLLSGGMVDSNRAKAVEWFTRRVLFFTTLAGLFTVVASQASPERIFLLPGWEQSTGGAVAIMLLTGFMLQGCVHLYRMHSIWHENKLEVPGRLPGQWLVNTAVVGLAVVFLAFVLPAGISPLTASHIAYLAGRLLTPLLDSEFSFEDREPAGRSQPPPSPGGEETSVMEFSWLAGIFALLYFLLPFLLGTLALLLIAGSLLLAFLGSEWEKARGFIRVPIMFYLWFRKTMRMSVRLLQKGGHWAKKRLAGTRDSMGESLLSEEKKALTGIMPSAPALYIRRLFTLLIRNAAKEGLKAKPEQTPSEYADGLRAVLPEVEEDLSYLVEQYNEARYSAHEIPEIAKRPFHTVWNRIVSAMHRRLNAAKRS